MCVSLKNDIKIARKKWRKDVDHVFPVELQSWRREIKSNFNVP